MSNFLGNTIMEKRYLYYIQVNGKINAEIRYESYINRGCVNKDEVLKTIELQDCTLTLSQAIKLYPYEANK